MLNDLMKIVTIFIFFHVSSSAFAMAEQEPTVRLFQENIQCQNLPCVKGEHAIVFVHGLTGSKATWQNANGSYWPKMMSDDPGLASFDVFRVDYDSFYLEESPDVDSIDAVFFKKMSVLQNYKSITFIAHSLGGLIVQRYLQDVNALNSHLMLNKYRIAILMGTPSEGTELANFASWLSNNPTLRILKDYDENDYLKLLGKQMWYTMIKHDVTGCSSLRFFIAYENLDTDLVRVVSKSSATARAYACQMFDFNHIELPKPKSYEDERYTSVKQLLLACLAGKASVCPPPSMDVHCGQSSQPIEPTEPLRCNSGTWTQILNR